MSDAFQKVADEAAADAAAKATAKTLLIVKQKEVDFVSYLINAGVSFDDAVKIAKASVTPLDELRKLVQPV